MKSRKTIRLLEENEEVLQETLVEEGVEEEEYKNYSFLTDDDEEILREILVEEGYEEEYKNDPILNEEDFQGLIDWYMELGELLLKIAMEELRSLTIEDFMTKVAEYDIYYENDADLWYLDILRVCEFHRLHWGYFEGEQKEAYRYNGALDY